MSQERAKSRRTASASPSLQGGTRAKLLSILWILTLAAGALIGVRLGALALLSAAWGVVFLCVKLRPMALVAFLGGLVIIAFLFLLTGRIF